MNVAKFQRCLTGEGRKAIALLFMEIALILYTVDHINNFEESLSNACKCFHYRPEFITNEPVCFLMNSKLKSWQMNEIFVKQRKMGSKKKERNQNDSFLDRFL